MSTEVSQNIMKAWKPIKTVANPFEFVVVAGARARQLLSGCAPKVEGSDKLVVRAQEEVLAGEVTKIADDGV